MLYPLKFKSIYFNKIWGGRRLEKYRSDLPNEMVGESWDISDIREAQCEVMNGKLMTMTISKLKEKYGHDLMGLSINPSSEFPILIKIIDASEDLSIQVHPNDDFAKKYENGSGKTEMWYIFDSEKDAKITAGTICKSKEELEKSIEDNTILSTMCTYSVKNGQTYGINSGLLHSIGKGNLIIEIQQPSDITYRLYDYGRDRQLHIIKALEIVDLNLSVEKIESTSLEINPNNEDFELNEQILIKNNYFTVTKSAIKEKLRCMSNKDKFEIITNVSGAGKVIYKNEEIDFNASDSILIPACIGEYLIIGNITYLKTYVT